MLEHSPAARKVYKSKAWRDCRLSYISTVHGLCERCSSPGHIVHHKVHLNTANINDPYIVYGHDNLEYLCQRCHNQEHFSTGSLREGYRFDEYGDIIEVK